MPQLKVLFSLFMINIDSYCKLSNYINTVKYNKHTFLCTYRNQLQAKRSPKLQFIKEEGFKTKQIKDI